MEIIIERFDGSQLDFVTNWRNPYIAAGWRVAAIRLNTMAFCTPLFELRTYAVAYHSGNFNIVPPTMQPCLSTVYDALGPFLEDESLDGLIIEGYTPIPSPNPQQRNEYYQLSEHDLNICNVLPSGWETSQLREYLGNKAVPPHTLNMLRLTWGVGVAENADCHLIHPSFNRSLTIGEYEALNVNTIDEWIQQLKDLFLSNHWKEEDWQSWYSAPKGMETTGQWLGNQTPGADYKEFNLVQYCPLHYRTYEDMEDFPLRRFNIDANGKVIVPWEEIERNRFEANDAQTIF